MATKSRETLLTELRTLADGARKYVPKPAMVIAQRKYSGAQIAKRIQAIIDAENRITLLTAELSAALATSKKLQRTEATFLQGVRAQLLAWYSHSHATLAELGLSPKRPSRKRTSEQRVLMTAKNRATRAKRGTLGPKQKKAIHGDVTRVVITPIVGGKPEKSDA